MTTKITSLSRLSLRPRAGKTTIRTTIRTTTRRKAEKLLMFEKLFYGNEGNFTCRWLRSNETTKGLTRSCYIAQRLLMVRYVLEHYFDYDFYSHNSFENKFYELMGMVQNITRTRMFEDQNTTENLVDFLNRKIREHTINDEDLNRLKLLTRLSSGQFELFNNVKSLKDVLPPVITKLFADSMDYPIPLAFGLNKPRRNMYEIDHWFVLYQGKICGAAGLYPVDIAYFESEKIKPDDFYMFLRTMNETETEHSFNFFADFMKKTMVPLSNALQTYEEKTKPGKDDDETRGTHIKIPIELAINNLIEGYKSRLNQFNIFQMNGLKPGESYATNLFEAMKSILPLKFIDVSRVPELLPTSEAGGRKRKRKIKLRKNTRRRTAQNNKQTRKIRKNIKRKVYIYKKK